MAKNRPGTILYALGMTQHTTGVQGIRGVHDPAAPARQPRQAGQRGQRAARRAERAGRLRHGRAQQLPPGYMDSPTHSGAHARGVHEEERDRRPPYLVNMLKAFFGDAATPENDFGYAWLPKRSAAKDYGTLPIFEDALAGKMKMLWIVGQNPAVTIAQPQPDVRRDGEARDARGPGDLGDGDGDLLETARRRSEDRSRPRCSCCRPPSSWRRTAPSPTPAGMVQWRNAAVKPPGQAKPDGEIVDYVFRRVRDLVHELGEPQGRDHQEGLLDVPHRRGRPAGR